MTMIASIVVFQVLLEVNGIQQIPPSKTQISNVNEVQAHHRIKRDDQLMPTTSVISHEFPLTEENLSTKPKKEDLHTFAELKNDPEAFFPPLFTICSTIMTTTASHSFFFSLLGNGNNNYLNAFLDRGMESLGVISGLYSFKAKGKINRVFPEQWVSTCLAVNTKSGLLQWVVDTKLIANVTIEAIIQNAPQHPADLSGKLLLGARNKGPGGWSVHSNQVTLLNIFSYTMSIKEMQKMTIEGEEKCLKHGDYLSWQDMSWTFKGHATLETWSSENICRAKPIAAIFVKQEICWDRGMRKPL